jgi:non-ribosomal peptide synthetase component E (peptide arylation enzyme)
MNSGTILTRHAHYRPDHLAVVFEENHLSYQEFNGRVNRLANAFLEIGISKGDKMATIMGFYILAIIRYNTIL